MADISEIDKLIDQRRKIKDQAEENDSDDDDDDECVNEALGWKEHQELAALEQAVTRRNSLQVIQRKKELSSLKKEESDSDDSEDEDSEGEVEAEKDTEEIAQRYGWEGQEIRTIEEIAKRRNSARDVRRSSLLALERITIDGDGDA